MTSILELKKNTCFLLRGNDEKSIKFDFYFYYYDHWWLPQIGKKQKKKIYYSINLPRERATSQTLTWKLAKLNEYRAERFRDIFKKKCVAKFLIELESMCMGCDQKEK